MSALEPKPYDHDHENEVTLFAATNFRNQQRKFGIRTDDRRRHVYTIGKTGMGKTTLLENLVLSDIYAGHGLCYLDPHGDAAQKLLDYIPSNRINDVVYFNPGDVDNPIGFNIFEVNNENTKHLIASGLMGVFKKIWPDVWSARMEYILMNTILALLDAPGSSLLGITRILVDDEYRKRVVSMIQDPVVKTFWVKEFASWQEKYRTEAIAPVQNKVGQFLSSRIIRNVVAQVKSTIDLRDIMDSRKILIVNLSKGLIGEENMRLLGGMIITKMQMTVMERVDTPEHLRQDFYLYVDEFQNFANESFASILSEARKYRLNLTVAHQYIEQMDEETRAAIFGNVGTMIVFRVGAADATLMEQEFMPTFTPEDLVNLRKFDVYLKLMINGASSEPFSATTLPPIGNPTGSFDKVIRVSRERYSRPRNTIEDKILRWSGLAPGEEADNDAENDIVSAASELGVSETDLKNLITSSPSVKEATPSLSKKKKETRYEIPCSVCGEVQKLTFEPDWTKPWFCKDHLDVRGKIPTKDLKFYDAVAQAKLATQHSSGSVAEIIEPSFGGVQQVVSANQPISSAVVPPSAAPVVKKAVRIVTSDKTKPTNQPRRQDFKPTERKRFDKKPDRKPMSPRPAPPDIRETVPVDSSEEISGLSLSQLASRANVTKESEREKKRAESISNSIESKPTATQNVRSIDSNISSVSTQTNGTEINANHIPDDSENDSGPKQIKPGQVIKF
ncbi:MAG: type IV secretion system DNA-binding domain-containing protein [Patescibacteria group bacterium]